MVAFSMRVTTQSSIARVVAKIYCGLGLLKKENIKEVHRADLIGQHIGETEAKTNGIIDSALDGVLFLDRLTAETRKAAMKEIRQAEWFDGGVPPMKQSPHSIFGGAV